MKRGRPMPDSGFAVSRPEGARGAAPDREPSASGRVLIVDDDAAICLSLGDSLRDDGFDVTTAANGSEALEVLRTSPPPSAIILDLMMPVMDGWDFRNEQ